MISSRSKLAITSVTQTRDDVPVFIELSIEGTEVDRDVRVGILQALYAFGCTEQTDVLDALNPPLFEQITGGNSGPSCREHGIEDQTDRDTREEETTHQSRPHRLRRLPPSRTKT